MQSEVQLWCPCLDYRHGELYWQGWGCWITLLSGKAWAAIFEQVLWWFFHYSIVWVGPSCHSLKKDWLRRRAGSFVSGVTAAVKHSSHSHCAADQLVHRPALITQPWCHCPVHAVLSTENSDFWNVDASQKWWDSFWMENVLVFYAHLVRSKPFSSSLRGKANRKIAFFPPPRWAFGCRELHHCVISLTPPAAGQVWAESIPSAGDGGSQRSSAGAWHGGRGGGPGTCQQHLLTCESTAGWEALEGT